MEVFRTEFDFELPMGYVDESGNLHKEGTMRLATAGDEIMPMKDPRVQQNPAYLTVILLSRVMTKLGSLPMISNKTIEGLFSGDFNYLQNMYNRINEKGANSITTSCPKCNHQFDVEVANLGE